MRTTGRKSDAPQQAQHVVERQTKRPTRKNKEPEINWQTWWPFTRATGTAFQQLNRKQPKTNSFENIPEALL